MHKRAVTRQTFGEKEVESLNKRRLLIFPSLQTFTESEGGREFLRLLADMMARQTQSVISNRLSPEEYHEARGIVSGIRAVANEIESCLRVGEAAAEKQASPSPEEIDKVRQYLRDKGGEPTPGGLGG